MGTANEKAGQYARTCVEQQGEKLWSLACDSCGFDRNDGWQKQAFLSGLVAGLHITMQATLEEMGRATNGTK